MSVQVNCRRFNIEYEGDRDKIRKAISKGQHPRVHYTVIRNGEPVERFGTITRVTASVIWIGAFCYRLHDPREIVEYL